MRLLPLVTFAVVLLAVPPARAGEEPFAGLQFLLGQWTAVGSGKPGDATGSFSFKADLGGKILVRRNVADYPPKPSQKEGFHHEDSLTVFPEGGALKAIYFDNEGHVIRYTITGEGKRAVFLSDEVAGTPRFRLTYEQKEPGIVTVEFAMAPPGKPFQVYTTGLARRVP